MTAVAVAARKPAETTRGLVAAALDRAGGGRLAAIAVPAPVVALDAARAALPAEMAFLWDPPAGAAAVGAGAAARIDVQGATRIEDLLSAAGELWKRVVVSGEIAPRLWGGLAFAPGAADEAAWAAFGDGSFVLPRMTYVRDGERAWLVACAAGNDAGVTDEIERVLAALSVPAPVSVTVSMPGSGPVPVPVPDVAVWRKQVEGILGALAAGGASKIVAARRSEVGFSGQAGAVLARLAADAPGAWRFAFGREGATFLGATPERLVRVAGEVVESEALAGSIGAGRGGELLASAKDRVEHALVVDAVVEALAPRCDELMVPSQPVVRELRHILHLATPVRGRLRARTHVLSLAAALHPTPAVGGAPRAAALDWIAAHEPAPRGWYAGPVGWFDAAGDGELVVALRSALVDGARALVYAGAGIVAGSDPDRELAETTLKQRVMLRALGVT